MKIKLNRNHIALSLIFSVMAVFLIASPVFADELYRVSGISMEPTLHDGDVVKLISGDVKQGDIVIADTGDKLVIKRVVGDRLVGDNREVTAVFRLSDVKVLGGVEKVKEFSSNFKVREEICKVEASGSTSNAINISANVNCAVTTNMIGPNEYYYFGSGYYYGLPDGTKGSCNIATSIPANANWAVITDMNGPNEYYYIGSGYYYGLPDGTKGSCNTAASIPANANWAVITDMNGPNEYYYIGSGYYYGDLINIDTTPPTILTGAPSATVTKGGPNTYTITYSGADSISLEAGDVTLNKTGTANGSIAISGTGNTSRTVTISNITGDGTLGISIAAGTASDTAGNTAPASAASTTFTVDNTAPTGTITINNGAATTNTTNVTLTITSTDTSEVTYMKISEDPSFQGIGWEDYATSTPFTLTRGDGTKTVYIKFKDAAGNESTVYNDTITLEESNAAAGDTYVTCDIDGLETGTIFSTATVTIPVEGIDSSGNYAYYGIDIGTFEKPESPADPATGEWKTIYIKRLQTDKREIKIENFGDITQYQFNKVYSIGYRILYYPQNEDDSVVVATKWQRVTGGTDSYFKPHSQALTGGISFNPGEGTYIGDVKVAITCSDPDGVQESHYVWTEAEETPTLGWNLFTDPSFAIANQALATGETEKTWFLYVKTIDKTGVEKIAHQAYKLIRKTAIAVRPEIDASTPQIMTLAGTDGEIKLLDKQGQHLATTDWGNSGKSIYTALAFSTGEILYAGQEGYFRIRNKDGHWKTEAGKTWAENTPANKYSIKALTHLRGTDGKYNNEILMLGSQGHWQVIDKNGNLSPDKKGDTSLTEEVAAVFREDGKIIMAGSNGKVLILETSGNKYVLMAGKEQNWTKTGENKLFEPIDADSKHIYAAIALSDKSIIFAGQGGKIQRRDPLGYWQNPLIWSHTADIKTMTRLPNGNILMTGGDGYYQILKVANDYTLSLGQAPTAGNISSEETGRYELLTNVQSAFPREDSMVAIAGGEWNTEMYKLNIDQEISINLIELDKVTLRTIWDNQGYKEAEIQWKKDVETTWNSKMFSGSQVTVDNLDTGEKYHFRVKSLMEYPIYFISQEVTAQILVPVVISNFTDRVTGANAWMDQQNIGEEQIRRLNKYTPGSEVVCKFVLDPSGGEVQKYDIKLNANTDNAKIGIENLRVIKVIYDANDNGIYDDTNPEEKQKYIEAGIITANSGDTEVHIKIGDGNNVGINEQPGMRKVIVYCKYNFKKEEALNNEAERQFTNRVEVTPKINGDNQDEIELTNTILIRDVKIEMR